MDLYRIEVGNSHGVKPGNIVGAIANETGIDGDHIARIKIEENYSTVELPAGMPKVLFQELKKVRVAGQQLNISAMDPALVKKAKGKWSYLYSTYCMRDLAFPTRCSLWPRNTPGKRGWASCGRSGSKPCRLSD